MPRKSSVFQREWLPVIVETYQEREPFDLYEMLRVKGRMRVGLTAEECLKELISVLQILVKEDYLEQTTSVNKVTYWGITFDNFSFVPKGKFKDLVGSNSTVEIAQSVTPVDVPTAPIIYQNKYSLVTVNIDKIFESLVGVGMSLWG